MLSHVVVTKLFVTSYNHEIPFDFRSGVAFDPSTARAPAISTHASGGMSGRMTQTLTRACLCPSLVPTRQMLPKRSLLCAAAALSLLHYRDRGNPFMLYQALCSSLYVEHRSTLFHGSNGRSVTGGTVIRPHRNCPAARQ